MKAFVFLAAAVLFLGILLAPKELADVPPLRLPFFSAATPAATASGSGSVAATDDATASPSASPSNAPPPPAQRTTAPRTQAPVAANKISGSLLKAQTAGPAAGVVVQAYRARDGVLVSQTVTNAQGAYGLYVPSNNDYKILFTGSSIVPQWYFGKTSMAQADQLSIKQVDVGGINALVTGR